MLKSGREYLDSLKDGRVIYIGDETVVDPTTHPAFDRIANTYAALYDLKKAPENMDLMSYEERESNSALIFSNQGLRLTSKNELVPIVSSPSGPMDYWADRPMRPRAMLPAWQ